MHDKKSGLTFIIYSIDYGYYLYTFKIKSLELEIFWTIIFNIIKNNHGRYLLLHENQPKHYI